MARRKSRKNADAPKRPAVANAQEATPALSEGGKKAPAEAAAPSAPVDKKRGRPGAAPASGGVRLSTCIAGMVLTLVLGLYLGTLLPGVIQDMRGQHSEGPEVAALTAPTGDTARAPSASSDARGPEDARPEPGTGSPAAAGLPPDLAAHLAHLEAAVRKDPASAANWTELGNLFFDAGRVREAINAYERSLAIAPGNADVLTDLGIMYRENHAPEKAVDCFRKAFAADPRHENALFNAGVVLYNDLGRKDEAVAAWRRLLALNPQARAPDGRTVAEMVRRLEETPRR